MEVYVVLQVQWRQKCGRCWCRGPSTATTAALEGLNGRQGRTPVRHVRLWTSSCASWSAGALSCRGIAQRTGTSAAHCSCCASLESHGGSQPPTIRSDDMCPVLNGRQRPLHSV